MPLPRSLHEFVRAYPDEVACRRALIGMRWPEGVVCPAGHRGRVGAIEGRGLWQCGVCRAQFSPTSGTALHRSHLPLATWFAAGYLVSRGRGLSSLSLAGMLGIDNQETAWLLLRRFRTAMGSALTERLSGEVEADETLVGGVSPGAKGRTTKGTAKSMVLVAAERGSGRARMRVIPDARAVTLDPVMASLIDPGSTVITDGHAGYSTLPSLGFAWDRRPHPPGGMTHDSPHATPLVDGLIAQMKDWLAATYRKPPADLDPYLDEFCFRREFSPDEAFRRLLTAPADARSSRS